MKANHGGHQQQQSGDKKHLVVGGRRELKKKEEKKGNGGEGTDECMLAYFRLLRFRDFCVLTCICGFSCWVDVVCVGWGVVLLLLSQ